MIQIGDVDDIRNPQTQNVGLGNGIVDMRSLDPEVQKDQQRMTTIFVSSVRQRDKFWQLMRSVASAQLRGIAFICFLFAFCAAVSCATGQTAGKREAILIANAAYPDADTPIRAASKDIAILDDELRQNAFNVDLKADLSKQDMRTALHLFLSKLTPGTVAFIYYSGIGIQASNQTYLIPVDAQVWSEADVKRQGVNVNAFVRDMDQRGATVKIVMLDAARRNPFERRFRTYSAGLAGIDAPKNTIVMLADAPNKVRDDSSNDASLFMSDFVRALHTPNAGIEDAMTSTRNLVSRASNGEEVPLVASSLDDPFYLGHAPARPPLPKKNTPSPATDQGSAQSTKPTAVTSQTPIPTQPAKRPEPLAPLQTPSHDEPAPASNTSSTISPPSTAVLGSIGGRTALPAPGDLIRDCAGCPETVVMAVGSFMMGAAATPFDRPAHRVSFTKSFAIGRTEVTIGDWDRCVADHGCDYSPDSTGQENKDNPVVNISWPDTKDYLAWLSRKTGKSYRLPSEAEWEYAAHGGTNTTFSWGPSLGTHTANCSNCGGPGDRQTLLPVKSFSANGYGLYDMAGNAAEWVEDCWHLSYRGAPDNASAWDSGNCDERVLRGGSFDSSSAYMRPTARFRWDANRRSPTNGFRVVREIPQ